MRNMIKKWSKKLKLKKAKKFLGVSGWNEFELCYKNAQFFINNGKSKDIITFRHERISFAQALNKVTLYRQETCHDNENAVNIVENITNFCEYVTNLANNIKTDYLDSESFRSSPVFQSQNADY